MALISLEELEIQIRAEHRWRLKIWTLFCIVAGLLFLLYAFTSLAAGRANFVMPLDDVYIHFQYAKQIAHGQPYVYNPGLPPTSGATSFLYPYILAVGYLLGFHGLALGLWAMGIGALALLGSMWLIYRLANRGGVPDWLAITGALAFALCGPVAWHFMSGMETGLVILFTLAMVYTFMTWSIRNAAFAGALLALIRPEGSVMAVIAVGVMLLQERHILRTIVWGYFDHPQLKRRLRWHWLWLMIPLVAVGVQPIMNRAFTGSMVATGNQAKSLFGMIPADTGVIGGRIADNFARMWSEFLSGYNPREGWYLPPLLAIAGLLWLAILLVERDKGWQEMLPGVRTYLDKRYRGLGLMLTGWLLAGTAAVATLDTAFWHFKRYQMPFMALWFPLVIWSVAGILKIQHRGTELQRRKGVLYIAYGLAGLTLVFVLVTGAQFIVYYARNVSSVYLQPLQMALWLAENTPEDAVVAVHDVGMMRYIGGRTTIDMVGLTTPGAADAWRNGPGAVAEFLIKEKPDYVAAYADARGLSYLADTGIYGDLLAGYTVNYAENSNVALAGHFQGIYKPNWSGAEHQAEVLQPSVLQYLDGFELVDSLNVGELGSEKAHDYRWRNAISSPGFPTEVYEQHYISCAIGDCRVLDGGRRINGLETFMINFDPDRDLILVTRLHPVNGGTLTVGFEGDAGLSALHTRVIPSQPGTWLEIATLIPAETLKRVGGRFSIVPDVGDGNYMPYYHWAYQGHFEQERLFGDAQAVFQNGAVRLMNYTHDYLPGEHRLKADFVWQTNGSAQGDYRVFVHLYGDVGQPPAAQTDMRPGGGTLPPGNWLPGVLRDEIVVDLTGVPAGRYKVAIGLYSSLTGERLLPENTTYEVRDGRLFVGDVEIR